MSFVIVNGKRIPVEEFEGSSVDDERAAHRRNKANRNAEEGCSSRGMVAATQYLRGDPRSARKKFQF